MKELDKYEAEKVEETITEELTVDPNYNDDDDEVNDELPENEYDGSQEEDGNTVPSELWNESISKILDIINSYDVAASAQTMSYLLIPLSIGLSIIIPMVLLLYIMFITRHL